MKKNKHAAMIIEWAMTGKPVQRLWCGVWTDEDCPIWHDNCEYRFKPEVIRSRRFIFLMDGEYQVSTAMTEEDVKHAEEADYFVQWEDDDWVEHQVQ